MRTHPGKMCGFYTYYTRVSVTIITAASRSYIRPLRLHGFRAYEQYRPTCVSFAFSISLSSFLSFFGCNVPVIRYCLVHCTHCMCTRNEREENENYCFSCTLRHTNRIVLTLVLFSHSIYNVIIIYTSLLQPCFIFMYPVVDWCCACISFAITLVLGLPSHSATPFRTLHMPDDWFVICTIFSLTFCLLTALTFIYIHNDCMVHEIKTNRVCHDTSRFAFGRGR